ncbi:hypothetical protein L1049_008196 [Liquidambar formosana]|uniref:CCHC-type domain-containing protein n=1 Tax=Liquidambar formosana TaxID=63359 RepID=A0AAP0X850_LIQFO
MRIDLWSSPRSTPVCHYCGKIGHIRPNCFHLRNGSSRSSRNPILSWDNVGDCLRKLCQEVVDLRQIAHRGSGTSSRDSISDSIQAMSFPRERFIARKEWVKKKDSDCLTPLVSVVQKDKAKALAAPRPSLTALTALRLQPSPLGLTALTLSPRQSQSPLPHAVATRRRHSPVATCHANRPSKSVLAR